MIASTLGFTPITYCGKCEDTRTNTTLCQGVQVPLPIAESSTDGNKVADRERSPPMLGRGNKRLLNAYGSADE